MDDELRAIVESPEWAELSKTVQNMPATGEETMTDLVTGERYHVRTGFVEESEILRVDGDTGVAHLYFPESVYNRLENLLAELEREVKP